MCDEITIEEELGSESETEAEAQDNPAQLPDEFPLSSGLRGVGFELAVLGSSKNGPRIKLASHSPAMERSVAAPPAAPARVQSTTSSGFDFIETYIDYADVIEAPPEAHEAVAIQLLATALNPNVCIQHGSVRIPLDLWVLLLSESGFGRNTLVDLSRPILRDASLEKAVLNTTWGSKQAFFQNVAEKPAGLYMWPEMAIVLHKFADSNFAGTKEWITDRYDSLSIPDAIRYRETGKKADTPPILFSRAPRLNILATSSLDWFTGNLTQEDTMGGFVPRWILRKLPKSARLVPCPQPTKQELIRPLGDHLRRCSELEGDADLSRVLGMYDEWYRATYQRFSDQNSSMSGPFFNRLRTHVLKLAVIHEVSQSATLSVTPEAMSRAFAAAQTSEQTIFDLLPSGMSKEGSEVSRMEDRIRAVGAVGLPKSDFTRCFQSIRAGERESRLQTLIDGEVVFRFWRGTQGRRAAVLVHWDHAAEYTRRFPDDERV